MTDIFKPSFISGEVSPKVYARQDLDRFHTGLSICRNMIVDNVGGASNRPPTAHVSVAPGDGVLIPYKAPEGNYVLEFTDYKMRIVSDGSMIGGGTPVEVVTPYPVAKVKDIKYSQDDSGLYLTHSDYNIRIVTNTSSTTWFVTEQDPVDGPYLSREDGDEDIRIKLVFLSGSKWGFTADSPIFDGIAVGDSVRLGFPTPGDLSKKFWTWYVVATVTSTIVIEANIQDGPYPVYQQIVNYEFKQGMDSWEDTSSDGSTALYDFTNQAVVLTDGAGAGTAKLEQVVTTIKNTVHRISVLIDSVSGTSPTIVLKVGTSSGASDIYLSGDMTSTGPYVFSVKPTQETIYVSLDTTGSTDGDTVGVSKIQCFPIGDNPTGGTEYNTTDWRLPVWGLNKGFPSVVGFYKGRIVYANSPLYPQNVWLSSIDEYGNFGFSSPGIDSDAITVKLDAKQANTVRWLQSLDDLIIGTKSNIWRLAGSRDTGVLTPTSIELKVQSGIGCADIVPELIGRSILAVHKDESTIRAIAYAAGVDGYDDLDVTLLARHLFEGLWVPDTASPEVYSTLKLVDMAFAETPDKVLWCVRNDGTLLGLTYSKKDGVYAWHRHDTTGYEGIGFTNVCVVPGEFNVIENTKDDVYFMIKRPKISSPFYEYHVERLARRVPNALRYDYSFLDDHVKQDTPGSPSSTVYGLDHLLGLTVTALADGSIETGLIVTDYGSGNIGVILPRAAEVVYVGLGYTSEFKTLDLEVASNDGTTVGKLKRVVSISVYLKDTRSLKIGTSTTNAIDMVINSEADSDSPTPLVTGVRSIDVECEHENRACVYIKQEEPVPLTILAVIPDVDFKER